MYHESMCRESMYCARTKSFSLRPDNESLCFEHDAPYAGISLREQLFITNIVLMPLQRGALTAFRNYGVTVIPYSKLEERAPVELAA